MNQLSFAMMDVLGSLRAGSRPACDLKDLHSMNSIGSLVCRGLIRALCVEGETHLALSGAGSAARRRYELRHGAHDLNSSMVVCPAEVAGA